MPEEQPPFKIAIIGGGLGGLFAALSIQHHCQKDPNIKIHIDVYEQAAEYKEIGAGLGLAVNAAKLLDRIGIFDEARKIAGTRDHVWISFRRYDNSDDIYTIPLPGEEGARMQLSLHRAEFLELLVRAVRARQAAVLHTDKRCVHLEVIYGSFVPSFLYLF
jgi:salicylate hydroxylase